LISFNTKEYKALQLRENPRMDPLLQSNLYLPTENYKQKPTNNQNKEPNSKEEQESTGTSWEPQDFVANKLKTTPTAEYSGKYPNYHKA
jgi:hypothetical protein